MQKRTILRPIASQKRFCFGWCDASADRSGVTDASAFHGKQNTLAPLCHAPDLRGHYARAVLRPLGLIFAAILILNAVGTATDTIPEDIRHLLLAVGGLGLAAIIWLERRRSHNQP